MPSVTGRLAAVPSGLMTKTNLLSPSGPVCTASSGTSKAFEAVRPVMVVWTGVPAFNVPFGFSTRSHTSTVVLPGIERGADERDLSRQGIVEPANSDGGRRAHGKLLRLGLREVELGQQCGGVHYRNHGSAGGGRLPGKQRPVGHHAGDRAANLRVAQLGFGAQVLALGGGELSLRALERCLVADLLHRFEMLLGNLMGGLSLNQRSFCRIQIAARDRSLGKELGAAVHNALRQVQVGGRLGKIQFRLDCVFGHRGPSGNVVCALGRVVSTLVVECRGRKVAVFKRRQKLTRPDVRTALHVELLDRRGDLGRDGSLGQRRQRSVGRDLLGDITPFGMGGLHVHLGGRGLLRLAAGDRDQSCERQQ